MNKQELGPLQSELITALRSGEFKQATNTLQTPELERFCCLGVACKIAEKHGAMLNYDEDFSSRLAGDELSSQYGIAEMFGFHSTRGRLKEKIEGFSSLASLNDNLDIGFLGIADLIEADPANFFSEPK